MSDAYPLTIEQAAQRLGVATRTMQRYVEAYEKKRDRSKGFTAIKVAAQRGRGYVWRFRFDTDAPDATAPDATVDVSVGTPDATVARALFDASGGHAEALQMVLVALGEARRESADLAYRLGVSETERQRLEAEREELRRRAEAAEVERDALRAQAAPQPPSATPPASAQVETAAPEKPAQSLWQRLRRAIAGE